MWRNCRTVRITLYQNLDRRPFERLQIEELIFSRELEVVREYNSVRVYVHVFINCSFIIFPYVTQKSHTTNVSLRHELSIISQYAINLSLIFIGWQSKHFVLHFFS